MSTGKLQVRIPKDGSALFSGIRVLRGNNDWMPIAAGVKLHPEMLRIIKPHLNETLKA